MITKVISRGESGRNDRGQLPLSARTRPDPTSANATHIKTSSTKKPHSAAEIGNESDVSLSDDDDDDDDVVKLYRHSKPRQSGRDGSVPVPTESTIFLQNAKAFAEKGPNQPHSIPSAPIRSGAGLNSGLSKRQYSKIGSMNQTQCLTNTQAQQASAPQPPKRPELFIPPSKSDVSGAGRPAAIIYQTALGKGVKSVGGVFVNMSKLHANSNAAAPPNASKSSGSASSSCISSVKIGGQSLESILYGDRGGSSSSTAANGSSSSASINKENSARQCPPPRAAPSTAQPQVKKSQVDERKQAQQREIDRLLGQKSAHAEECESEWFESFDQRTNKLAEREAKRLKAAQYISEFTKCFHCKDCKLTTESELSYRLCTGKGHSVSAVKGIKWFFECSNCRRRDFTLTVAPDGAAKAPGGSSSGGSSGSSSSNSSQANNSNPPVSSVCGRQFPTRRCECGSFSWVACNKMGTMDCSLDKEHKLVLTVTDWTSKKDLFALGAMQSNLR